MREVALVAKSALEDVGLTGWPKTSGSRGIHINVRIEPRWTFDEVRRAALAHRARSGAASAGPRDQQVVEGGAPRRLPRLQPERQGPHRRLAYSVRPTPDARVSMPLALGAGRRRSRWRSSRSRRSRRSTRATATRTPASTTRSGRSRRCWSCPREHEAEGSGDAPWPPNYRKQEGEPPRVQPSRQRRASAEYNTPEAEAAREKSRAAMERRFTRQAEERAAETRGRLRPRAVTVRSARVDQASHRDRSGREERRGRRRSRALEESSQRHS